MLSSFRNNYLYNYLLAFGFVLICWIPTFIIGKDSVSTAVFHSDSILRMGVTNVHLLNGIALAVIIVTALMINQLTTEYGFSGKLMTMGIYFFSVLAVSLPSFTLMNPFILINFFLLFFIRNIFRLPETQNPVAVVFNASIMLGIASLYFAHLLFLILIVWIGIMIHRINMWRNYFISLIGAFLPYLFILTWYYWSDQLDDYLLKISSYKAYFLAPVTLDLYSTLLIVLLGLLIMLSLLKTIYRLSEKNINLRRNLIVTIYYFLFSVVLFLLFAQDANTLLIVAVPSALLLSNAFHNLRNYRWYDIAFGLISLMILTGQYIKLFY